MSQAESERATGFARVLVDVEPFHLDHGFDYLVDPASIAPRVGWRVEVDFAGRRRRGIVLGRPDTTDVAPSRLRALRRVLGEFAWLDEDDLGLVDWAATRWCATRADVVRHALPGRHVAVETSFVEAGLLPWTTESALAAGARPAQPIAADRHAAAPDGWRAYDGGGDLFADPDTGVATGTGARAWRPLADEDVAARLVEVARATLAAGRDVLVAVPDGGSRIAAALVAGLHDHLDDLGLAREHVVDVVGLRTDRAVARAWLRARTGQARVVVGERRVAFWPLVRPGLFVVLDEANPGHKERRSPRHHAREVLLERARRHGAVALLTTSVPSAATWALLRDRRIGAITPSRADEVAAAPVVVLDDAHHLRLGRQGTAAIRDAVASGDHAVVLAARRGEGRAMVCTTCGNRPTCPTCGSSLAGHGSGLDCPRCGWATPRRRCGDCGGSRFAPLAAGTERLAAELRRTVEVPVAVLEGYDAPAPPPPAVLVMTRGSVLDEPPGPVGAVVAGDVDSLALRPSVDAPEDTLRLLFVLGSWLHTGTGTGRARPRMVVVTADGDGPVATAVRRWDPAGFWREAAAQRAPFPPARSAVVVTCPDAATAGRIADELPAGSDLALGPVPLAPDRHRVLVLTEQRVPLVARLADLRAELARGNVFLVVDVDPVDLA